jgi:ATP-dependent DNA helicase RecG
MPEGRKPIKTAHYYDAQRLKVFGFINKQITQGRQVYVVYPLIEESDKTAYKNLMDGYESICRAFPGTPISIVHGKMKPADKEYEMQRFAKGETKIMVATTVIEVGINVPNATVMIIENADHFGLSQLHQLRGRVGRGQDQSYCILMTDYQISAKSRERIQALLTTNDGFEIADMDLRLRGPGDLMGIQQSGALNLKIADLRQDNSILHMAREVAKQVIQEDPLLEKPYHLILKNQLASNTYANFGNIG